MATQFLPASVTSNIVSLVRYATRVVTDGALNSTTTVTSATAIFTSADVGAAISGTGIPASTTIASVTNGTTVVLSAAATATSSGVTLTITQTPTLGAATLTTALNSAFAAKAGNVQSFVDTTSGQTTNAVVVSGDTTVLSVAQGNWVGWVNGAWLQLTPSQLAASYVQYYTS